MFRQLLTFMFGTYASIGCTNPYKARDIDDSLDTRSRGDYGKIGLNDDKEVVVQQETSAHDKITTQTNLNNKVRQAVRAEVHALKWCHDDLADPRLGGNGIAKPLPEFGEVKPFEGANEEFGKTQDGSLKFVKREYYKDRLEYEEKAERLLRGQLAKLTAARETCEREMGVARVKHGLPAKRYVGEGHFEGGTWVQTKKHENSLDDAFERAESEKAH